MNKIKILLTLPNIYIIKGGARRSMISMCKLLEKSGEFEIIYYCTDLKANFERLLDQARPNILLCYINRTGDLERRSLARSYGCNVVYSLRSHMDSLGSEKMDGCLCSSEFIRKYYLGREHRESTNIPLPLIEDDVIAKKYNPQFVTMLNAIPKKGLYLTEAILKELWINRKREDILVRIYEGYGNADYIKYLAETYSLYIMAYDAKPANIYKQAKCVIVPSIWDEPAGRVVAESLVNGIPVTYSNRGGLSEVANGGGTQINIPFSISENLRDSMELRECAKKWVDWIIRVWDDFDFHQQESLRSLNAGRIYLEENIIPKYVDYFKEIARS